MKVIALSNKEYTSLKLFDVPDIVYNSEAILYEYKYKREEKLIKAFYLDKGQIFANKLYTVEMLDDKRDYIPDSIVIPEALISVKGKIVGFSIPKINATNLEVALNDKEIDCKEKIYYLKRIGEILQNMSNIRKYSSLDDFYINDLHESNFLINLDKRQLHVVDADSFKIAHNKTFPSKYLSPYGLIQFAAKGKYKMLDEDNLSHFVANENTDLFCYSIVILNYLYGSSINKFSLEKFYDYLTYLSDIGINKELVDIFSRLVINNENENPANLLDSLSYEQIAKANKNIFSLKHK